MTDSKKYLMSGLILIIGLSAGAIIGYVLHATFAGLPIVEAPEPVAKVEQAQPSPSSSVPGIAFKPGQKFKPTAKKEISTKLADPYSSYYSDNNNIVSALMISAPSKRGAYEVTAIYGDGTYEEFLWGKAQQKEQAWWIPDCDKKCELSDDFKAMYPEINKLVK